MYTKNANILMVAKNASPYLNVFTQAREFFSRQMYVTYLRFKNVPAE